MRDVMKPIINEIERIAESIPGWTPVDQLYTLFQLVYLNSDGDGDVLEIGSWCGRSSVILGLAAKISGKGRVKCIDLFPEKDDWKQNSDGSYSFEVVVGEKNYGGYQVQTVWKEPFEKQIAPLYEQYNGVYDIFEKSIKDNHVGDVVTGYKGTSDQLNELLPLDFKCKVAFIDGDHSYDAVCNDINNVVPFLVPGGWICFDDAFVTYEGVNRAVTELIVESGQFECCQQMTRKFFVAKKK